MNEAVSVLYIDQGTLGQAMIRTLENEAISPIGADNGIDALKQLDSEAIDIVIVPDTLPQLDLHGFIDRARSIRPDVTIVVSGAPDDLPPDVYHVSTDGAGRRLLERIEEIMAERAIDDALEGQDRLEGVALDIAYSVVTAEDDDTIFQAFHDQLARSDLFEFVWVWRYDRDTGDLFGELPLSGRFSPIDVTESLATGSSDFMAEAIESGVVTVARGDGAMRSAAAAPDQSSLPSGGAPARMAYGAVPFTDGERTYGVALLGSGRPDAFDSAEQSLLGDLGAIVGRSLGTADRHSEAAASNPERIKQFVEVLAHELRNPLQIAISYLELGQKSMDDDALDRVATAHDTIEAILETVVTMADPGGIDEVLELDLVDVALDTWRRLDSGSAELTVGQSVTVEADRDLLVRLLTNLFKNAIEHGGPAASVRIGALPDGQGFFVEDDGPGIPETDWESVLQWGYSTSDDHLGIGLGFVREIAEAHGWDVTITEGQDGGARFEITTADASVMSDGGANVDGRSIQSRPRR